MLNALLFGLAASSALVLGAVAGAYWSPPQLLLAAALAFACGAWLAHSPSTCSRSRLGLAVRGSLVLGFLAARRPSWWLTCCSITI